MAKENTDQSLSEGLMILKGIGELLNRGAEKLRQIAETPEVQNIVNSLVKGALLLGQYTAQQQHMMKTMSLDGWFPSVITFMSFPKDHEDIDGFMDRFVNRYIHLRLERPCFSLPFLELSVVREHLI